VVDFTTHVRQRFRLRDRRRAGRILSMTPKASWVRNEVVWLAKVGDFCLRISVPTGTCEILRASRTLWSTSVQTPCDASDLMNIWEEELARRLRSAADTMDGGELATPPAPTEESVEWREPARQVKPANLKLLDLFTKARRTTGKPEYAIGFYRDIRSELSNGQPLKVGEALLGIDSYASLCAHLDCLPADTCIERRWVGNLGPVVQHWSRASSRINPTYLITSSIGSMPLDPVTLKLTDLLFQEYPQGSTHWIQPIESTPRDDGQPSM